jgi:DNA-binding transcriptional regulator LsrR (DeoR family)
MGLLSEDTVRSLVGRGAVGEIASHWWFDLQGRIVAEEEKHALGLGLDGLSRMVARRARVIAVVGASRERVLPLKVALNHCLVNTLITDHITARELLYES